MSCWWWCWWFCWCWCWSWCLWHWWWPWCGVWWCWRHWWWHWWWSPAAANYEHSGGGAVSSVPTSPAQHSPAQHSPLKSSCICFCLPHPLMQSPGWLMLILTHFWSPFYSVRGQKPICLFLINSNMRHGSGSINLAAMSTWIVATQQKLLKQEPSTNSNSSE